MSESEYRTPGQVCPSGSSPEGDCHLDQRWPGFRGLACPHCACRLVVACRECDSGAVVKAEDGSYRCREHAPKGVET